MGIVEGFPKYVFFTLITPVGFVCMYLFGGVIVTWFNTLSELFSGHYINAFIEYYIKSALPPTSVGEVVVQAIIGGSVAGVLWFIAMARRGVAW